MKVLITGARGFIGSAFLRRYAVYLKSVHHQVVAFARATHDWTAARLNTRELNVAIAEGKLRVVNGDLLGDISGLAEGCDACVHFAARTFVDHSIRDPGPFIQANTVGTLNLLEECRRQGVKRFIQVSTDEVYGQILEGQHDERSPWNPRNPYAASKAAADALVISYWHTFSGKMWVAVTRTENNYGPFQHPQKALPVFVRHAMAGDPLPIYGDGQHVRQWLHVNDHCRAIFGLLNAKTGGDLPGGEVWHVAGCQELQNLELARKILKLCDRPEDQIRFLDDHNVRPGHDRRYALDCAKIQQAIGWKPTISLDEGLEATVKWYRQRPEWMQP